MKKSPNTRVRQNGSAVAAAHQARKNHNPIPANTEDAEVLRKIQLYHGRCTPAELLVYASDLDVESAQMRRAAAILTRSPNAWPDRSSSAPQSRKNHNTTRANAEKLTDTVTVVFNQADGREFTRVDFPAHIYALIERAIKRLRISLDEFFERAVTEKSASMTKGAVR